MIVVSDHMNSCSKTAEPKYALNFLKILLAIAMDIVVSCIIFFSFFFFCPLVHCSTVTILSVSVSMPFPVL